MPLMQSGKGGKVQPQEKIYNAVVARGYHEGLSEQEFAAKQVAKLGEEFGELAELVRTVEGYYSWWSVSVSSGVMDCRTAFDTRHEWRGMRIRNLENAKAELADVAVVVLLLAGTISRITGQPFDVVQAAVEKAEADIERGVRKSD